MSTTPVIPDSANVKQQSGSAGSQSGSSTPAGLLSTEQSQLRSYANATKPSPAIPAVVASSSAPPPVAVSAPQHASTMSASGTATNGPPIVGNGIAAPNGAPASVEHSRKPSVTIGASGASGYIANGGPVVPSSQRLNIAFGSHPSEGSPGMATSTPYAAQSSLAAPPTDPRISSPSNSPTPIPQPPASGGRPPATLQSQNNAPSFGNLGGSESEMARSMHATPPGVVMGAQPAHLRRQSSQQSEMANQGLQYPPQGPSRNQYGMQGGRGRGFPPNYPQPQMSYSPGPNYGRPMQQQRSNQGYPAHFQNQPGMPYSSSPHPQSRSPMPQGSHPSTPQMQHQQMAPNQMPYQQYQQPPYQVYNQHLGPQNPAVYGQQPNFDPNAQFYGGHYPAPPQYLNQPPPGSPRSFNLRQAPPTQNQQFVSGQFMQNSAHPMSRSPSHASTDRPASTFEGGHQHSSASQPPTAPRSHTPSGSTTGAASQTPNFVKPAASKAIRITDAAGNVIQIPDRNKGKNSPAPVIGKSSSPSNGSAAPTPPPPSSTPHNRTESKTTKTAEEIREELKQSVKKAQSEEKTKEDPTSISAPTRDAAAGVAVVESDVVTEAPKVLDGAQTNDALARATEAKAAEASAASAAASAAAEQKAADEKAAEDKREKEEAESALEQAQAESRAAREKEEKAQEAKEAALREEADAAAEVVKTEQSREVSEPAPVESITTGGEDPVLDEDDEMERMIAEMEAKEREDEEKERAFQEKRKKEAEEKAAREKEAAANADEEMRRAEREAEEAEELREKQKAEETEETEETKAEREQLFASLKKPTIGPGADDVSGTATPTSEDSAPPAIQRAPSGTKPKPAALKLDTAKPVEPAQPTAGMQALKSARMLQLQNGAPKYPEGIQSPNPAVISGTKRAGRVYNIDFLMQFQDVFKEKPSIDWEQKLKETIGDNSDGSAGPKSGRTPVSSRAPSGRGGPPPSAFQGMGTFGQGQAGRTLPPGTTSQARFDASNRGPTMSNPLAQFSGRPGAFPMGNMPVPMARQGSMPGMPHGQSPRNASQRNRSTRQDRAPSRKEQEQANKSMPLTASGEVKALETTGSGWKPSSVGQGASTQPQTDASGRLSPEMVQRKVKSNLNKMTPERFDKISDQILEIAAQSKDETDGRTLRQVIALTFEKACDEDHWASMYAKFCARMMETMTPEIKDENITDKHGNPVVGGALFRKYLLNRCQEEFEKGWEVNLPEQGEGEEAVMLSDEYYIAAAAKRKGLGLIQFIGELYKLQMLSTKIMHQCFLKLLDIQGMPDEAAIESLVKLTRTVGATMEQDKDRQGPGFINAYFERIEKMAYMPGLPSRMHFMLLDVMDLRKAGWKSKDDQKGPKTIQEIRAEAQAQQQQAELERQRQRTGGGGGQGRIPSGRGDARNYSGGGMPPPNLPTNQVATDELRRLQGRQASRQASSGPARTLGPTSMFSRNNSGRQGLGPGGNLVNRSGDESGSSTRSTSRKDNDKSNTFSALAGLEQAEAAEATPASSPQVKNATPATTVTTESAKPAEPEPTTSET